MEADVDVRDDFRNLRLDPDAREDSVKEIISDLNNLYEGEPEKHKDILSNLGIYYSRSIANAIEALLRHASFARKKRTGYMSWWGDYQVSVDEYPESKIIEFMAQTSWELEELFKNPVDETKEKKIDFIRKFIQDARTIIHNTDPQLAKWIGLILIAFITFALIMSIGYGIGLIPGIAAWVAVAELFYFAKAATIALFACGLGVGLAAGGASAYVFFRLERGELVDLVDKIEAAVDADQTPGMSPHNNLCI